MSKHTPGPWEVNLFDDTERPGIKADNFSVVFFGVRDEDDAGVWGRTAEEEIANARLIAAAPDLLKACMMMDKAMTEQQVDKALDFVNAAIAKAKGASYELPQ